MSPAQQRLWFLEQKDPGSTVFNIPVALRLAGPLDVAALQAAFAALIERHEILRTTLSSVLGEPMQHIHPFQPLDLPLTDLRPLAPKAREAALLRELRSLAAQPFDLASGPLIRIGLWQLALDEHALMIVLHHAIADGWSLGVLYREISHYYRQALAGQPLALPELPIQYADYAHWHRQRMLSGELDRQRDYWLQQLQGYSGFLNLPTDQPRPARHNFDASNYAFRFPERLTHSLQAFSQQMGVTLFMSTITAYALLLSRYSGQQDLCIGIPVAGRSEAELEDLIGFFVNGMVIRFRFEPQQTLREVMQTVRQTVLDGFANQDLSVDHLFESLALERNPAYEPLVQCTFALQNFPRRPETLSDLDIRPIAIESMHSSYDLMLLLTETPESLAGDMVYNSRLFSPASIARMMRHLERLAEAMCDTPDAPLAALDFVSPAERYAVLQLDPARYECILPLNAMQRDLYMDTLAHPDSAQNTLGGAFEIHGEIDIDRWRQHLQRLNEEQPVLRTRLQASPVSWTDPAYQAILRHDQPILEILDWRQQTLSGDALSAALSTLIRQPFAVDGPLLRHILIQLAPAHWVVVLISHHLLLDGIAGANLLHWLADTQSGRPPIDLPAHAFHEQLAASRLAADSAALIDWWAPRLTGVTPPYCPGATPVSRATRQQRQRLIAPELWEGIRRFSRQQRITPQIFLKAIYSLLADAHCQCPGDLLIQEFAAARNAGQSAALGCYYQTLPFVVPRPLLGGDSSFSDLLAHTRNWQKESNRHSGLSIRAQRLMMPQGRCAFMFNYITAGLTVMVGEQPTEIQRFTPYADSFVQFEISVADDGVLMGLNYDPGCFAETAFLERMESLCRQLLVTDPQCPLRELDFLLSDDHWRFPVAAPALPSARPDFVSLAAQIAAQARHTPAALAVIQGERQLTYGQLLAAASPLCRRLQAAGAGRGQRVGICLPRSPEMIVALLAVLQSGAAYVPMDAAYPAERLQRIAGDAACCLIVTHSDLCEQLRHADCPLLLLDDNGSLPGPDDNPICRDEIRDKTLDEGGEKRQADDIFYVLYTSGSTGTPKGALIRDDSVANLVDWYRREFAITASDRLFILSAFGFDLTQKNFFAALTSGAALVLPDYERFDPDHLCADIARQRASLVNCAPSAFLSLLEPTEHFPALSSLRRVILGGEPIPLARLAAWLAHPDCHAEIINSYGPTECTDVVAFHRLSNPLTNPQQTIPIGSPVPQARLHVLDAAGRELPPFGVGELYISGLCVGNGYWRDAVLTGQRFVDLPVAGQVLHLYQTGDLVWRRADGLPVFLGRKDFQVKVRGLRIELGEIESALGDCFAEQGLTWQVLADAEQIIAFVCPAAPLAAPPLDEVHRRLAERLPDSMQPNALVSVAAWPLSAHGKVDRQQLRQMASHRQQRINEPPRTTTEQLLAQLWREALGRREIDRHDSFFSIGGHSLLAARIVSRLRSEFAIDLPLRVLFDSPRLADLAAHIDQRGEQRGDQPPRRTSAQEEAENTEHAASPTIARADRSKPLPLSFPQRRLWFLERLEGLSATYNMPAAFRLRGKLHLAALQQAFDEIVRRHEILRTRLVDGDDKGDDGEPQQIIDPARSVPLPLHSLTAHDLAATLQREAAQPFDLAVDHPLRVQVFELATDEHVVFINIHHVAADAGSSDVLMHELSVLYNANVNGERAALAELPVQYVDFAAWQQLSAENSEQTAASLDFWRQQLAATSAPLPAGINLPTDFPRQPQGRATGENVLFAIDADSARQIRALADASECTVYQLLLTVFFCLLQRWSGDNDIVVGSPIANRPRPEFEGLIGFFVNTLPIRLQFAAEPTFRELLQQVRQTTLAAYGHAELPFEQLVEKFNPERRLNQSPFFQVMFSMHSAGQTSSLAGNGLRDLTIETLPLSTGAARLDLTLSMQESENGLSACLEYASNLFLPETAQRLSEHFRNLLAAALRAPDTPLAQLELLSKAERHRLLVEWNRTDTAHDRLRCLHHGFEQQAQLTPDATALIWGEQRFSYRWLLDESSRIACLLQQKSVGPEQLVGVCLDRSPTLIAALLGVLRAGGAYVALDPAYPPARLHYIINDSAAPLILTSAHYQQEIFASQVNSETLALDAINLPPLPENLPFSPVDRNNLAYVLYTSGSTGQPKGVAIEHHSPAALIDWARSLWSVDELAGVLAGTSICFDLSIFEIFLPLSVGGSVILAENVLELPLLPTREQVTLINTVPSAIDALLRQNAVPTSVRVVNLAGEPLSTELADRVHAVPGIRKVYDLYGPSEDTTYSTFKQRQPGDAPSIGRPIANTQLFILDRARQPVPVGVPGEIYLAGEGLARAYLGRPDLTAERFVDCPHRPGERMYRTGDLARFRPNADVEYLGRLDYQVKLRGFRIELGEIENVLVAFAGVSHSVVTVREASAGNPRLVGYVAHHDGSAILPALRRHLHERLPDYMVPAALVVLPALPLTPNGKIDRKALPAPERYAAHEHTSPEMLQGVLQQMQQKTPQETELAKIWGLLLGVDTSVEAIQRDDDFFALGGHSLLAVRLQSRLRDHFSCTPSLRELFEHSRLHQQAALLARLAPTSDTTAIPLLPRGGPLPPFLPPLLPLSFAQERLWFLDQLEPGSAAYNMPGALRLCGKLNIAALTRAIEQLVDRHEILRQAFPAEAGTAQAIPALSRPQLAVLDLRQATADAVAQQLQAAAEQPFNLASGPLLRASLLCLADDEAILALTLHHIIADGWSIGLLLQELCALYGQADAGLNAALTPLTVQYADFAAWQRERYRNGEMAEQLAYWQRTLAGAPALLTLPTDRPRPAAQGYRGSSLSVRIEAPLASLLTNSNRRLGATHFMTLLTAYAALLGRHAGQEDVVIGFPVAGRTRSELENLPGLFVNTLPIRLQPAADVSFGDLLQQAKQRTLEALSHQELPFEKLVDALGIERSLAWSPLFQALFVVQNTPDFVSALPDIVVDIVPPTHSDSAKFDLSLYINEGDTYLDATFEYDRDLFERKHIEHLAADFVTLLEAGLHDLQCPLASLPGLTSHTAADSARQTARPSTVPSSTPPAAGETMAYAAPSTPAEQDLAAVWCEILKRREVSALDNYFELGGDSILSIVMIARLRDRGWLLQARDIFRQQTIRELAPIMQRQAATAHPGPAVAQDNGPLPLTPLQHLFFDLQAPTPGHFNQSLLLKVAAELDPQHLALALTALQENHPALRSRFRQEAAGWQQWIATETPAPLVVHAALSDAEIVKVPFMNQGRRSGFIPTECCPPRRDESRPTLTGTFVISAALSDAQQLEACCNAAQRSLNIVAGPLFRADLFPLASGERRLLLLAHHLVVDAVSWRILLADLETALGQLQRGQHISLMPEYCSPAAYRQALQAYDLRSEAAYWAALVAEAGPLLPVEDQPASQSPGQIDCLLDIANTRALLGEAHASYNTRIPDLLLTALGRELCRLSGRPAVLIDNEGHGRDSLGATTDLNRSVGWFTTLYPVRLPCSPEQPLTSNLVEVKEALRSVPNGGIGHALLHRGRPLSDVCFNYLGQSSLQLPGPLLPGIASEPSGQQNATDLPRRYRLSCNAIIADDQLQLSFNFAADPLMENQVRDLASRTLDTLQALIAACCQRSSRNYTPSDFTDVKLAQDELNDLLGGLDLSDVSAP